MVVGGLLGALHPEAGVALKPVADGFISLIKMVITPVIFCSVVLGIAVMGDLRKLGRVGAKALIYFEVVSSIALCIGLTLANVIKPGAGMHADRHALDTARTAEYVSKAHGQSIAEHLLGIIPKTFFGAFTADGSILQVLLIAILFGIALAGLGERGRAVTTFLESANLAFFAVIRLVLMLAPLGAGAAMAVTMGTFGLEALKPLALLIGTFYLTCLVFILVVLGAIGWMCKVNIVRFIIYIRDEVMTVLATSSSESALMPLMVKLERLDRLFLQSRRHQHLPHPRLAVRRPGAGHRADPGRAAHPPGRGDAHQQGGCGRHRIRLRHPRRHLDGGAEHTGGGARAHPRRRSLHERGASGHQPHRQWHGHPGGLGLGRGARHRAARRRAQRTLSACMTWRAAVPIRPASRPWGRRPSGGVPTAI
jgi:hypothetical protein